MSKRPKSPKPAAEEGVCKKQKTGHWSTALLEFIKDDKIHVYSSETIVAISDKYPKAKFHYLVIPKEDISSLKAVTPKHVPLLKQMQDVAEGLAKDHPECNFRIGYHAIPSMVHLHLHAISDDFNSPCLKTKKHWNSFTTDFMLKTSDILQQLKEDDKVTLPSSETCRQWLNSPLKCNKCDYTSKTIPDLKRHILTH